MPNPTFTFFGTPEFATIILDELEHAGFLPGLVITQEDKPKGRHLTPTPPMVKLWAEKRSISVFQPQSLKDESVFQRLSKESWDLFLVASYGKIIPENILNIPKHQSLNVHPSLLPKLRGPSPIQGAILSENETGVSIMRLDALMDHGPLIAQKKVPIVDWPPYAPELERLLAHHGGKLLAEVIPGWINGNIKEEAQDESLATYVKKIQKGDAEINLSDDAEMNVRKIRAYAGWPNAYVFFDTRNGKLRTIIKSAHTDNGELILDEVIPAGRNTMSFADFQKGFLY